MPAAKWADAATTAQGKTRAAVPPAALKTYTLLLLDATGAYHREVSRQMENSGTHFTTPMMQLRDSEKTKVLLVTLAETTPVLEAAGPQEDLRRAGIEPWAWVVNSSVAAAESWSPLLRPRAAGEFAQIGAVAARHSRRYAVVPLLDEEPVGAVRLLKLASPIVMTHD